MRTLGHRNLIEGVVPDLSSDWESLPIFLGRARGWSAMLKFSGSPVGTFKIMVSNSVLPYQDVLAGKQVIPSTEWNEYTGSSASISAAGDITWNVKDAGYRWVKISYLRTSGSGSITVANVQLKGG
jgi:hypothetical protein